MKSLQEQLTDDEKRALHVMFASEGYKIWLEWSIAQSEGFFAKAVRGKTIEEREEARCIGLGIEESRKLSLFLADKLSESAPSDGLTAPDEDSEEKEDE